MDAFIIQQNVLFAIKVLGKVYIFRVIEMFVSSSKASTPLPCIVDKLKTQFVNKRPEGHKKKIRLEGVYRDEERNKFKDYVRQPGAVLVCGYAGVGKSTFVRQMLTGRQEEVFT
jgi:ribosome biogenesis GTPase A